MNKKRWFWIALLIFCGCSLGRITFLKSYFQDVQYIRDYSIGTRMKYGNNKYLEIKDFKKADVKDVVKDDELAADPLTSSKMSLTIETNEKNLYEMLLFGEKLKQSPLYLQIDQLGKNCYTLKFIVDNQTLERSKQKLYLVMPKQKQVRYLKKINF